MHWARLRRTIDDQHNWVDHASQRKFLGLKQEFRLKIVAPTFFPDTTSTRLTAAMAACLNCRDATAFICTPGAFNVITVVSGLPRSGTSLMMQMLVAGGIPALTDQHRVADEDNPRGYLELDAQPPMMMP